MSLKRRNNNTKNNYFKQMINRYGPDFIYEKRMERGGLLNEPPRIFKDLIRNKIDFDKESEYFYDKELLDVLITNATNNLLHFSTLYNAMVMYINSKPVNQIELDCFNKTKTQYELYGFIYNCLTNFKNTQSIEWIMKISFNILDKSQANLII